MTNVKCSTDGMQPSLRRFGRWPYKYELLDEYEYKIECFGKTYIRTVMPGWVFDGATFGWLIALRPEATVAAIPHDDGYECKGTLLVREEGTNNYCYLKLHKKVIDQRFHDDMDDLDEGGWNSKSWQRALCSLAFITVGSVLWMR